MDNFTLERHLAYICRKKSQFVNYYIVANNNFSQVNICKKFTFIIYHSDITSPGHWIVFLVKRLPCKNKFNVEYFDSFGKTLSYYSINFPLKRCITDYSNVAVQHERSESCGIFCLYFVYFRCKNVSYKRLLINFSKNTLNNEKKIRQFYLYLLKYDK